MPLLDDLPPLCGILSYAQVQTGVPFGEVSFVRDWLEIRGEVGRPRKEHAKRPVDGFNCKRSEVGVRAVIFFLVLSRLLVWTTPEETSTSECRKRLATLARCQTHVPGTAACVTPLLGWRRAGV